LRIAAMGGRAMLIERSAVGGVCLNTGCIPTKALLHVSKLYWDLKSAGAMGIDVDGASVNVARAVAHKDTIVERLTKGLATLLKHRGVEVVAGRGRLIDATTVGVDSPDGVLRIGAKNVILATGTVPASLPGIDVDGQRILSTDHVLSMRTLPESILIVGAGPNGVETATMLAEFGSRVTLVEAMDRVLPTIDPEAGKEVARSLKKRRVAIHCDTRIDGIERRDDRVVTELSNGQTVEADALLVAVGRRTQVDGLGLDEVGVEHDGRFVKVDARCATSVGNIYAIGDITGRGPFAHVAYRQGTVAASNIMGRPLTEDYRIVPKIVFSHPEVATVGRSQDEARKDGIDVSVGRFRYQACGAAQAYGEPSGLCKLVAESDSGRVIGATIVGIRAGEVIHEIAMAMRMNATAHDVAETIHAHPSLAEPVAEAADALLGMPLHGL
jgi:dihydrolipoamide dehydrogenase